MVLGARDGGEKSLHDRGPVRIGARSGDLDEAFVANRRRGQVFGVVGKLLFADEVPVGHKNDLQHPYRFAFEFEVRVAPRAHLRAGQVALGDVDAARKADVAVYDQNFAVVAVVDFAGQPRENDAHKALHFHARIAQVSDIAPAQAPAAYVVVNQAHFDPFPGFPDQDLRDLPAQRIVFDNIIFKVDRRTGAAQGCFDLVEGNGAVVQYADAVVVGQQGFVAVEQQRDDVAVFGDFAAQQQRRVVDRVDLLAAHLVDLFQVV